MRSNVLAHVRVVGGDDQGIDAFILHHVTHLLHYAVVVHYPVRIELISNIRSITTYLDKIHIHLDTYIHTYIHTYTSVHIYIHTYIRIWTHTYCAYILHIHTYIYVHACIVNLPFLGLKVKIIGRGRLI